MKKNWYLSVGAGALSIFGAGVTAASAQTASNANTGTTVEDVIVTASRRSEKLQDVPIAVQALRTPAMTTATVLLGSCAA